VSRGAGVPPVNHVQDARATNNCSPATAPAFIPRRLRGVLANFSGRLIRNRFAGVFADPVLIGAAILAVISSSGRKTGGGESSEQNQNGETRSQNQSQFLHRIAPFRENSGFAARGFASFGELKNVRTGEVLGYYSVS